MDVKRKEIVYLEADETDTWNDFYNLMQKLVNETTDDASFLANNILETMDELRFDGVLELM